MDLFWSSLGLGVALLAGAFTFIVLFSFVIALIRIALNPRLGSVAKIFWILVNFIPGVSFFYFAFVDRNHFLKFVGWTCLVATLLAAFLGGSAIFTGLDRMVSRMPDYGYSRTCIKGPGDDHMTCREFGRRPSGDAAPEVPRPPAIRTPEGGGATGDGATGDGHGTDL